VVVDGGVKWPSKVIFFFRFSLGKWREHERSGLARRAEVSYSTPNGMGCMLRGSALAKLDDKGRLKLPSAFRSVIEPKYGNEFFVSSIRGDSVRIYPLPVYANIEQRLLHSSTLDPATTKLRNSLNYFGQRTVMDAQGRILIHPLVRDRACINGDVAVLGQQTYLELWNREAFEEKLTSDPLTDDDLGRLAELGF
jgi:MraZ protein